MGRVRNSRRRTSKNKQFKKGVDTKRRPRDVDQIQDDIKKEHELQQKMGFEIDEDLPGLGQYYCTECGRHFSDQSTLESHQQSKLHKRRFVANEASIISS
jgi:bud site selection protein 20